MKLKTPQGDIDITHETVTPETAKTYLKTNTKNRKPRRRQIQILRRDLESGAWKLSHQGIAFGESGRLLDGQHRLLAIVESGIAAELLVFRGMREDTQEFVDTNAGRTVAENLALLDGCKSPSQLCAYANAIASYWADFKMKVSLPQTRAILQIFPKLHILAEADTPGILPALRRAHFTAAFGVALHAAPSETAAAFDAFTKGRNLTEDHPSYHLREFAIRSYQAGGYEREGAFRKALDCLQLVLTKQPMRSIKECTSQGSDYFRQRLPKKYAELKQILRIA